MNFDVNPSQKSLPERYFLFQKNYLFVVNNQLPSLEDLETLPEAVKHQLNLDLQQKVYITHDNQYSYWGLPLTSPKTFVPTAQDASMPENFKSLRSLFTFFPERLMEIANFAYQILHWENTTQFCGHCGEKLKHKTAERAKECTNCGFVSYPHVAPAVIVLVSDGDKMLLAKNALRPSSFYSTLAGFVNHSESLEQTIHREIFEEVGVKVKNIKYFGSQSWPFPNALMVGFTADYDSGEINIDKTEIADAKWFSPRELPEMPPSISIARQLIDSHLRKVQR